MLHDIDSRYVSYLRKSVFIRGGFPLFVCISGPFCVLLRLLRFFTPSTR
jgi:hypothetical protein